MKTKTAQDNPLSHQDDIVSSFHLQGRAVKGRAGRLGRKSITPVLARHDFPDQIKFALAEIATLSALVGTSLKPGATVALQLQGKDALIQFMIAEYAPGKGLRATAKLSEQFDESTLAHQWRLAPRQLLSEQGHIALTIDTGLENARRYQGLVPIEGDDFSQALEHYFSASEQLSTKIRAAVTQIKNPNELVQWRAGGILLQQIAGRDHDDEQQRRLDWEHGLALLETVTDLELVDDELDLGELLFRLYHEEGVRVYDHQSVADFCNCSADRLREILASYQQDDLKDLVEQDVIQAKCEFCSRNYSFLPKDL